MPENLQAMGVQIGKYLMPLFEETKSGEPVPIGGKPAQDACAAGAQVAPVRGR